MFISLENSIYTIVSEINKYLSNYILLFLLLGVGIWYTIRTKFVQIRCFKEGVINMFSGMKNADINTMSPFQALSTAIAAQVGTGNIVGAAGAILIGGPGAIFWMWLIAFFGMATIYAEAVLAVKTRVSLHNGEICGGPVYYIREAFKGKLGKFLAIFFAVAIILALGCMGCMVQSNSIGNCLQTAFNIPSYFVGICLVIACCLIFVGGIKRLAIVVERIVPIMALLFIIGSIIVLTARFQFLPDAFKMIFHYAFQPQSILGGSFGSAIIIALTQGAKRGLFSNEAGMGSTPHAHALSNEKDPHKQGTIAMIGVFVDTFVILTLNALVIISVLYTPDGPLANGYFGSIVEVLNNTNLVQNAFGEIFGSSCGAIFVAVCLTFFAFSTILSWNLFGRINSIYLFGKKHHKLSIHIYNLISICFISTGTVVSSNLVWELADMFNNLMVIPNTLALFALTKIVVDSAKGVKT